MMKKNNIGQSPEEDYRDDVLDKAFQSIPQPVQYLVSKRMKLTKKIRKWKQKFEAIFKILGIR